MSIFDNVAYGFKLAGLKNKTELKDRLEDISARLMFARMGGKL